MSSSFTLPMRPKKVSLLAATVPTGVDEHVEILLSLPIRLRPGPGNGLREAAVSITSENVLAENEGESNPGSLSANDGDEEYDEEDDEKDEEAEENEDGHVKWTPDWSTILKNIIGMDTGEPAPKIFEFSTCRDDDVVAYLTGQGLVVEEALRELDGQVQRTLRKGRLQARQFMARRSATIIQPDWAKEAARKRVHVEGREVALHAEATRVDGPRGEAVKLFVENFSKAIARIRQRQEDSGMLTSSSAPKRRRRGKKQDPTPEGQKMERFFLKARKERREAQKMVMKGRRDGTMSRETAARIQAHHSRKEQIRRAIEEGILSADEIDSRKN